MSRILLVEDKALFRESLALLLEGELNLEVVRRGSSVAEWHPFLSSGEVFDAAVVHLRDEGDLIELMGELREANPRVLVLALTTSPNSENRALAKELGAQEVLSTDIPLDWLLVAIRRLAQKGMGRHQRVR